MFGKQYVSLEWMLGLRHIENTVRKTKWDLIIKGLENHRNLQALSLSSGNYKCLGSMMIQKTCA